jgi:hypothetical protein
MWTARLYHRGTQIHDTSSSNQAVTRERAQSCLVLSFECGPAAVLMEHHHHGLRPPNLVCTPIVSLEEMQ